MSLIERKTQFALALIISAMTLISIQQIEIKQIVGDASQNAQVSYHLATKGIYSSDGENYWNKREPLPNLFNAIYLTLFTSIDEQDSISEIIGGNYKTKDWLHINVIYFFSLLLSIWWVTFIFTKKHFLAFFTLAFPGLFYLIWPSYLNSMNTELLSTLLVTLIVGSCIKLYQNPRLGWACLCGVLFALFALTKAAGYYIAIVAIPILCIGLYFYKLANFKKAILMTFFGLLCFVLFVFPWMYRNYIHFDTFTISERGGNVLLIRAVKNEMNSEEYQGAFYYYSPTGLRKVFFEKFLGFRESDLEEGGLYQKLNRDLESDITALNEGKFVKLTTYYRIGKYQIPRNLDKENSIYYGVENARFQLAKEMIREDPLNHLKLTIAFAWRGIWNFGDLNEILNEYDLEEYRWIGHLNWLFNFISFISFVSVFLIAILYRKPKWFALTLFPIGIFLFHALLTHFIPRYSVPLIPIFNICFVILGYEIFKLALSYGVKKNYSINISSYSSNSANEL